MLLLAVLGTKAIGETDSAWHLSVQGGIGRSVHTGTAPLTFPRPSIAAGARWDRYKAAELELSWEARHVRGSLIAGYVDLAVPLSFRIHARELFVAVGLAPRLGILVSKDSSGYRRFAAGVDPHLRVGYAPVYATVRYMHDVIAPIRSSSVEQTQEAITFGIGAEVGIGGPLRRRPASAMR